MPIQEENKVIPETHEPKELNKSPEEFKSVKEQVFQNEFVAQDETPTVAKKTNAKRNAKITAEAASATAVIGLASFVVISTSGLINVTMDGHINDLVFQDNGIQYNLTVSDVEEDNDLFFSVFQGSKEVARYAIEFEHKDTFEGDLEGFIKLDDLNIADTLAKIENPAENPLTYDFHLCGDTGLIERTYDSWTLEVQSVKTASVEIKEGDMYCLCGETGYYVFTMTYDDPFGLFTDFKATITDSYGTVASCDFTSNLHEQQKIFVLDLASDNCIFELSYKREGQEVKFTTEVVV